MSSGEEKPKAAAQPDGKATQRTKSDVGMNTYKVTCTQVGLTSLMSIFTDIIINGDN